MFENVGTKSLWLFVAVKFFWVHGPLEIRILVSVLASRCMCMSAVLAKHCMNKWNISKKTSEGINQIYK